MNLKAIIYEIYHEVQRADCSSRKYCSRTLRQLKYIDLLRITTK
jgi:hypothetical protein